MFIPDPDLSIPGPWISDTGSPGSWIPKPTLSTKEEGENHLLSYLLEVATIILFLNRYRTKFGPILKELRYVILTKKNCH
jgi:hypothetical protein